MFSTTGAKMNRVLIRLIGLSVLSLGLISTRTFSEEAPRDKTTTPPSESAGICAKALDRVQTQQKMGSLDLHPRQHKRHFYFGLAKSVLTVGVFVSGYTYGISQIKDPMVAAFIGLIGGSIANALFIPMFAQFLPKLSKNLYSAFLPNETDLALRASQRDFAELLRQGFLRREGDRPSSVLMSRIELMHYLQLSDAVLNRVSEFLASENRDFAALEIAEFAFASRHFFRDLVNDVSADHFRSKLSRIFKCDQTFYELVLKTIQAKDRYWKADPTHSQSAYLKILDGWGITRTPPQ